MPVDLSGHDLLRRTNLLISWSEKVCTQMKQTGLYWNMGSGGGPPFF